MKWNDEIHLKVILGVAMLISLAAAATPTAQAKAQNSSKSNASGVKQWSVQVERIGLGNDVSLEPAFQVAIYENLLQEVARGNTFDKVFRSGDRNASAAPDLLILKTTVLKYVPGSQTRRAVTTVSGATKISVQFQLCTRDRQVLAERVVGGNVRFLGGNLRATYNLARNMAKAIKQAKLVAPGATAVPSP